MRVGPSCISDDYIPRNIITVGRTVIKFSIMRSVSEQFSRRISDEDITENFLGIPVSKYGRPAAYSGPRDFIGTFRSGARIRGFNIQDDVSEPRKRHYGAM